MTKHNKKIISIDHNAHIILNNIKAEMNNMGRSCPNYSEAIRYMNSLRSDPI